MNKIRGFYIIFIFLFFISVPAYGVVVDKVLATVNGEPVTLSELEYILQPIYARYEQVFHGEKLNQYKAHARKELLEQLVENKLILHKAKKDGIAVTNVAVEKELAHVKENFSSGKEFEQALGKEGLTLEQYKKKVRDQLTIKVMIEKYLVSKIIVRPEDIRLYYKKHSEEFRLPEQFHIERILVKDSKEKIEQLYKQLQEGKTLQDKWDDLGLIPKDKLKPALLQVLQSLKPGQFSKILESKDTYYIILLKELKPAKIRSLSQAWSDVDDRLFRIELQQRHKKWIDSLKARAHIEFLE